MLTAMTIDINESFWDQTCLAMILVSYVILQCEDFYFMHTLPQLHLYYASMMGRLIKEKPFIKREICNCVKCVFGSNKYDVMPLKFED